MYTNDFDNLLKSLFDGPVIRDSNKFKSYTPNRLAVDLENDKLELAFSVQGHDPKNVEVDLTLDTIRIKAKKDINEKSVTNQFIKNIDELITLTNEYDGTTAVAEIKNGILTITVEKKEEQKPKKLSIKF